MNNKTTMNRSINDYTGAAEEAASIKDKMIMNQTRGYRHAKWKSKEASVRRGIPIFVAGFRKKKEN